MTDYGSTTATGSTGTMAGVGADVMEVILRGLETARKGSADREGGEELGLFCGFAYGAPGTFCPFAYWHSEAVVEPETTSS
ncbi:hypothetical protein Q9R29_09015 [Rothia sp. ARF10]|nr:hypothetical protein [Rothia sp. ARF10]